MIQVRRLGHATFSTENIERETEYWSHIMGFVVSDRTKDRVFLSTKYGQEAIALVKGQPGWLQRLSFQVAREATWLSFRRTLRATACKVISRRTFRRASARR